MKKDWLWDRNISERRVLKILHNPLHHKFIFLSSLLLSRKNTPQEVFRDYLKPEEFCRHWTRIKRQMRKDAWNNPRIEFWQAVYEKMLEKFRARGINISSRSKVKLGDDFCLEIGQRLKALRQQKKLTQAILSKKLNIPQQMISRIEGGKENISLLTLRKIADELGAKVSLEESRPSGTTVSE